MTVFDAHCDTLQKITDFGGNFFDNPYHFDLKRIEKNGLEYIQVFAAFVEIGQSGYTPFQRCGRLIETYYGQINRFADKISHCNNMSDIEKAILAGKTASILSVEGGEALEGKLENLKYCYDKGVRWITLTWNCNNELCGGIESNNSGLTDFGKNVVAEMNRMGMVVDVSHISEQGFWDVLEVAKIPVVASHSNAKSICPHKRNLSDEQIIAIINCGGCIGINLYPEFVSQNECTIKDVIRHIDHILSLGGENNIGIGSDFDGINCLPQEINGVENIDLLFDEMHKNGYADSLINKVSSGNFLNLLKKILI